MSDSVSVSTDRASRADTPSADKIATVATAVITGKCQKSHTIVDADSAKITNSAAVLVRVYDDSAMPAPPGIDAMKPETPYTG
jgi:hypothetical protein